MTLNRKALSGSALVVLGVLFVAVLLVVNVLFRGARVDLTQGHLYTLSDGTRNILKSIDEPINLYFFWSDKGSQDIPQVRAYATRVREMLQEMASRSGGKLDVYWDIDNQGSCVVNWRESGGPVVKAPSREGFGTYLLDRSVPFDIFSFYRGQHTYVGVDSLQLGGTAVANILDTLAPGFGNGTLRAFPIEEAYTYPLERAHDAYRAVLAGARERVILKP